MSIRYQKSNEQLCQPRRSVAALTCAHIDAAGFSPVAVGLTGIPPYAQQDSNETGMT
jgi:hypothetical protein